MKTAVKTFAQLSNQELYQIMALRSEVFVIEQQCIYQDMDGRDQKAYHLMGTEENKIIAYLRIFKTGDYFKNASIGRVLVKEEHRGKGLAAEIMKAAMKFVDSELKEKKIELSAQSYLAKFYQDLGFEIIGEEYLEDGIPHKRMIYGQSGNG